MTYEKIFADVKKAYSKADTSALKGDFAFQFNITGEGEGIFYVAFRGGILEIAPYDYVDRNATLFASGENFVKMAYSKFTLEEAVATGLVEVKGNYNIALELNKLALTLTEKEKKDASKKIKKETVAPKEKEVKKANVKTAAVPAAKPEQTGIAGARNAVKSSIED